MPDYTIVYRLCTQLGEVTEVEDFPTKSARYLVLRVVVTFSGQYSDLGWQLRIDDHIFGGQDSGFERATRGLEPGVRFQYFVGVEVVDSIGARDRLF